MHRTLVLASATLLLACSSETTNPLGTGGAGGVGAGGAGTGAGGAADCGPDPSDPDTIIAPDGPDPLGGVFTLEEALEGLPPGDGLLRAVITTPAGDITCTFDERPENAVANFIGLARGVRPWQNPGTGAWVKKRFYDGLLFHRIIDDFMAQGGDPLGTGIGGPGYQINDEIFPDLIFAPGTLAYANAGPNTNGSQFFITEVTTDWLDGDFTIIGQCEPMDVIEALTAVETGGDDRPVMDTRMERVDITRCE